MFGISSIVAYACVVRVYRLCIYSILYDFTKKKHLTANQSTTYLFAVIDISEREHEKRDGKRETNGHSRLRLTQLDLIRFNSNCCYCFVVRRYIRKEKKNKNEL